MNAKKLRMALILAICVFAAVLTINSADAYRMGYGNGLGFTGVPYYFNDGNYWYGYDGDDYYWNDGRDWWGSYGSSNWYRHDGDDWWRYDGNRYSRYYGGDWRHDCYGCRY